MVTRATGKDSPELPDGNEDRPAEPADSVTAEPGAGQTSTAATQSASGQATQATATGDRPEADATETAADPAQASAGATAADEGGTKPRRGRRRSLWREVPVLVVIALVLAMVIKTWALQAFFIPSGSMENTLDIGDRVLINKLAYDFGSIHRGDVVVFNGAGSWDPAAAAPSSDPIVRFFSAVGGLIGFGHGQDDYVKRVIGLPGDHVACCDAKGRVTVNGVPLNETGYLYPGNPPSEQRFSIIVPSGRLWVMGDHRSASADSRAHMEISPDDGTIPESAVQGQVFVRVWPPSRWGFIGIPATFGQPRLNSALGAAIDSGNLRADPAGPQLPLLLGFAGAVPVTLLTRRLRGRRGPARRGRQAARFRCGPPRPGPAEPLNPAVPLRAGLPVPAESLNRAVPLRAGLPVPAEPLNRAVPGGRPPGKHSPPGQTQPLG